MNGKVYVDQALTDISNAYRNDTGKFIAEKIFPVVNVGKKTGIYFEYNKENLRSPTSTLRTGRGSTPVAEFAVSQKTYGPLSEHDLKTFITKEEYDMYVSPLDPETDAVNFLNEKMLIEKEVALAAKLSNTSTITNHTTLGTQWNASTPAGHPFIDIETGINTMQKQGLVAPNTIFMGYDVWSQLKNHPDLLDRVKYSSLGTLTTELFANLFGDMGITNVMVGSAVYDSSNEGGTASNGYIWGKNLWLAYVTPTPGIRRLNGGYTLVLDNGRYVDRWDDQDEKVTWIRNNDYYEQKLVGAEAFYLFDSCVA